MQGSFNVFTEHHRGRIKDLRFKPMHRHVFLYEKSILLCKRKEESPTGLEKGVYVFKNLLQVNHASLEFFFINHILLSLPNKVWETYCFCSVSYYYSLSSPFFLWHMNLSMADLGNYWTEFHETWWSYRYMYLVGPKVFSFVVKGVKVIFWGVQRGLL